MYFEVLTNGAEEGICRNDGVLMKDLKESVRRNA